MTGILNESAGTFVPSETRLRVGCYVPTSQLSR
jgi:hypothetical protein